MSGNQFLGFGLAASFVGFAALFGFARSGRFCFRLLFDRGSTLRGFTRVRLALAQECPGGETQTGDQRQRHGTGGGESELVSLHHFLEPIRRARWTGQNGFVIEVPLDVTCQAVGRFVAPGAIFLQALH
ncbi:MAG: hypothetical protein AAB466_01900, partial [Verrucomicrobiota bacterium]